MKPALAMYMVKNTIPSLPGAVAINLELPKATVPAKTMRPHANVQTLVRIDTEGGSSRSQRARTPVGKYEMAQVRRSSTLKVVSQLALAPMSGRAAVTAS
jgi:hypothetical protein